MGPVSVPSGSKPQMTEHLYLSTACHHALNDEARSVESRKELHAYCQNDQGQAGQKKPAECKWCQAKCKCPCHRVES